MRAAVPKTEQFRSPPEVSGDESAAFSLKLERVKRVGPAGLLDVDLLEFCRGAHKHYKTHFWVQARPFFIELWRRIDENRSPRFERRPRPVG